MTLRPPTITSFTVQLPADRRVQLRFEEKLSEQEFAEFCAAHRDLLVEREPDGQLLIMSPIHYLSGGQEADIITDLNIYAREAKNGKVYSSSTGFTLPDGSVRSADAMFVSNRQRANLTEAEKHSFARLVPEFIVEIRSDSDKLGPLQTKMKDVWMANGVRLGWLIDSKNKVTYVYRADGSEAVISGFDQTLDGQDVLPGFAFDLSVMEV